MRLQSVGKSLILIDFEEGRVISKVTKKNVKISASRKLYENKNDFIVLAKLSK